MVTKEKTPLDFDFSDVAGQQQKKSERKPKTEKKKAPKQAGIMLSIPIGKNRFICKDLAECTGEEFIQWAKEVYPSVSADANSFQSQTNKLRAFKQIQAYHMSSMTKEEREAKH